MNSFLSSEIEGRPEEHRVVGTLTSRYCFVHILYLLNARRSSDWHIISPTLKTSQTTDQESFDVDSAAKCSKGLC